MNIEQLWPWLFLGLGVVARVFVPWLAKRREQPESAKWAWPYVWPQLISVVLILLLLPVVVSDMSIVSSLPFPAAWLAGWAAADIGRETYKALAKEE